MSGTNVTARPPKEFLKAIAPVQRHHGRIIYVSGDIDEQLTLEVNLEMLRLQNEDPLSDITLLVDSYGGELHAAFAIVDMMQLLTCDIKTVCFGKAMSAGQFIFSTGTRGKRFMTKNARLMLHNPIAGVHGSVPDMEVEIDEIQYMRDRFVEHIADCSNINADEVKELIQRVKYLSAEEAIRYGFADGIIEKLK